MDENETNKLTTITRNEEHHSMEHFYSIPQDEIYKQSKEWINDFLFSCVCVYNCVYERRECEAMEKNERGAEEEKEFEERRRWARECG